MPSPISPLCWKHGILALGLLLSFGMSGQALELRATGTEMNVDIQGGPLRMELRPDFMDRSSGNWQKVPARDPQTESTNPQRVKAFADYNFPTGVVSAEFEAEVKGAKTVKASLSWQTESADPGFGKIDLWFPQEAAENLGIQYDGKLVFQGWNDKAIRKEVKAIQLVDLTSGQTLATVESGTGIFSRCEIFFESERRERGLFLRLFNVNNPNASNISDATQLDFVIDFE